MHHIMKSLHLYNIKICQPLYFCTPEKQTKFFYQGICSIYREGQCPLCPYAMHTSENKANALQEILNLEGQQYVKQYILVTPKVIHHCIIFKPTSFINRQTIFNQLNIMVSNLDIICLCHRVAI